MSTLNKGKILVLEEFPSDFKLVMGNPARQLQEIPIPDGSYDQVVLKWVLNHYTDLESRRKVIKECRRVVQDKGIVIAISRCCDSGEEVAKQLVRVGIQDLKIGNILNRDVKPLRPKVALMFPSFANIRRRSGHNTSPEQVEFIRNTYRTFVKEVLRSPKDYKLDDDQIDSMPNSFRSNLLDIALVWEKV